MRKKEQELRRSGFFSDDENMSGGMIRKQPMSTRARGSIKARFGGIAAGMMAELGQESGNDSSGDNSNP